MPPHHMGETGRPSILFHLSCKLAIAHSRGGESAAMDVQTCWHLLGMVLLPAEAVTITLHIRQAAAAAAEQQNSILEYCVDHLSRKMSVDSMATAPPKECPVK